MNRLDRISAILVLLQSRPVVRAADVAERFEVSLRTVYRDLRTLAEAGVPICGEAGIGYSLVEGYKLPPLMFTVEEALAFVTAEKFVEQLTDAQSAAHFKRGLDKVRAVLRAADKSDLAAIDQRIEVRRPSYLPPAAAGQPDLIQTILGSVHARRALAMRYYTPSREERTDRLVEPVGITYLHPRWYLTAYCLLRGGYRNFRLDRIEELTPTDAPFGREHPPLDEIEGWRAAPECLTRVVVHADAAVVRLMGEWRYSVGMVEERELGDGLVEQTYMSYGVEHIARWLLAYVDGVRGVEPREVRDRIDEILSKSK